TVLYIDYDEKRGGDVRNKIIPLFYVNVTSEDYYSELFFDYGNDLVKADDKEMFLNNELKYRNYKFEKDIISLIKEYHWKNLTKNAFTYSGKDITEDIKSLAFSGIHLYTNSRKKINVADFDNVSVSYGLDWFELSGNVTAGDSEIKLSELIDFRKKKEPWTEYNGQIIFSPSSLKKLGKNEIEKNGDNLKISKDDILSALEIVDFFGSKNVEAFSELSRYQDINLQLTNVLQNTLREYQKIGVKWLLSLRKNGFGGCLADDMGLGKTLQVISYFSDKSQLGTNALIVVPKTLIENWNREFKKFAPDISTYVYHGIGRNLADALNCRVIITTYGTLLNDIELINECNFDHLIIDEAQNIKNSRSKAYRAVKAVRAKTRIIMTGTPLENNIQEYWGLMKIANPTELSYKMIMNGLSEEQIIEKVKRLTSPFLLRRFKKDVIDDLPEKEERIVYCSFDDDQRKLYNKLLESIKYEIDRKADRYEIKSNSIILSGLMYLQEVCCHPRLIPKEYNSEMCFESAKLDQLLLMVDELYAAGHKIVIFSRFTRMLEIINKEFIKRHFNIFYLDGSTKDRQSVVDDFEESDEGVFLISLKAGGVGLNLISADTAILYDPWWNPAVEKQAEDRIYRIGQKKKVTVFKLIAAGTIEEKVQTLQETKKKLFDDVIEGNDIPQNITMKDIRNLLN
ncbi:DEAD/DEAH box helicase, partial [Dialister invisus]|uniref:DEAD/DEAH box helicase n=1 Tax=Dialister invisus TaxID=218538 RepID=UPI003FD8CBFD